MSRPCSSCLLALLTPSSTSSPLKTPLLVDDTIRLLINITDKSLLHRTRTPRFATLVLSPVAPDRICGYLRLLALARSVLHRCHDRRPLEWTLALATHKVGYPSVVMQKAAQQITTTTGCVHRR